MRAGLDLRHYVSFSGMVTFRNWQLDQAVLDTPLDRILVETDGPYLAPVPHRGKRNEPAFVRYVAERIAAVRGLPVEELIAAIAANTARAFRMLQPLAAGARPVTTVPTDIAIAQAAKLRPIQDVAAELGLGPDDILPYGRYKAKISAEAVARSRPRGRLVLVTGINPTPAGEGKSTVTVGVSQALRRLGKKVVVAIREPSLGPIFGVKGGAAGGGYAQVVPMDEINLHFTGDFHAVTSAHNLLSAMLDNHLHQGNALGLDPRRITWPRTMDMNDRALRSIVISLGGINAGPVREDRFVIVPGSEIMAILALASDLSDLEQRISRIIVGLTRDRKPVTAGDLKAAGAMTLLLKDAILPNLVQTLEGGPALVHAGPFGNIAHGCNSLVATKLPSDWATSC